MNKQNKLGRRDFLLSAAATTGAAFQNPMTHLLQMMMAGFVSKAQAQAAGFAPRKYLFIPLMGGPARWTFTPLSPDPADLSKMIRNEMVNTRFTSATTAAYQTVNIEGIAWPWLWQFNVARAGSGMRPMKDLMSNMMIIRGLNAQSNHGGAQKDRYFPSSIPYSFPSLVGDASNATIPMINVSSVDYMHVSRKGKAAVRLPPQGNLLQILMDGLTLAPRKFHNLSRDTVKDLMDAAQMKLSNLALVESSGFEISGQSLKAAKETMDRGFGDLSAVYTQLVAKYRDICERTNMQTLTGINDIPIGAATRGAQYASIGQEPEYLIRNTDMRTMITKDSRPGYMAEHFALAEFALTNGLSDSILLGLRDFYGLNMQLSGGVFPYVYFDEHNTGTFPTLLINTFANLCFGGCLLELIDRLKAKNIFNDTLIDLSGEMGRNPRSDQGGSDHGGEALDVAMWCGAFDAAPKVVGDVLAQPPASYSYAGMAGSLFPGSWGFGAANDGVGILTQGHLAATQAQILRTENPVRSARSLVSETNGIIKPILPLGRTK